MARTERGSMSATQGWKRVRFRTRRMVSIVRCVCHGGEGDVCRMEVVMRAVGRGEVRGAPFGIVVDIITAAVCCAGASEFSEREIVQ